MNVPGKIPGAETAAALDVRRLRGWVEDHRDELVADLVELVEQETPSDEPDLLDKGVAWVEAWLTRRLGEPDRRERHDDESRTASVLVMDYPGSGPGEHRRPRSLRHGLRRRHAGRTAGQCGRRPDGRAWRLRHEGAASSSSVWAIRALDAAGLPTAARSGWCINGDEEIGSPFSRPLIEQAVAGRRRSAGVRGAAPTGRSRPRARASGLFEVHARWRRVARRPRARRPGPAPSARSPGWSRHCTTPSTSSAGPRSTSAWSTAARGRTWSPGPLPRRMSTCGWPRWPRSRADRSGHSGSCKASRLPGARLEDRRRTEPPADGALGKRWAELFRARPVHRGRRWAWGARGGHGTAAAVMATSRLPSVSRRSTGWAPRARARMPRTSTCSIAGMLERTALAAAVVAAFAATDS